MNKAIISIMLIISALATASKLSTMLSMLTCLAWLGKASIQISASFLVVMVEANFKVHMLDEAGIRALEFKMVYYGVWKIQVIGNSEKVLPSKCLIHPLQGVFLVLSKVI